MRVMSVDIFDRWTRGAGLLALVALAWGVFVPSGVFWSSVLAAGLIGAALATALLMRDRGMPSLADVITSAEAEPVVVPARAGFTGGAQLRPRGEAKP
jgi:hypothetical protein